MPKADAIKLIGHVTEVLPNATFRIKVNDTDTLVLGHISGRLRQNEIRILLGDQVEMEFSPYDLSKGRICRRL